MNPLLETAGVVFISLLGVFIGRRLARLPQSAWLCAYCLPILLIASLLLSRFNTPLAFVPPFSWVIATRMRFVILALSATIGLTSSIDRLPYRFEKVAVCFLMVIVVVWFAVMPFLMPVLIKEDLSNIQTRLDANGNCYQTRAYTCGPAAAVTALGKFGLTADEGQLAILSYSSPVTGTLPVCLSDAIEKLYGQAGLKCEYRYFDSIDQLRDAGITLAVIKVALLMDHCIAVLEVSDTAVTVADPVMGVYNIPRDQFEKLWRFTGIVLQRELS